MYTPPFITERDQDPPEDCVVNSMLMAAIAWTNGELIQKIREWPQTKPVRARLRAHMGQPHGGTSIGMCAYALSVEFPDLPAVDPDIFTPWPALATRLGQGWCAVLLGNPSRVADPNSPLRTVQHSDDYDHGVYLDSRLSGQNLMLNPLHLPGGYRGEKVRDLDLQQFASRFTRPGLGVEVALFKKGAAATKPVPAGDPDMPDFKDWSQLGMKATLIQGKPIQDKLGARITDVGAGQPPFSVIGTLPDGRLGVAIDTGNPARHTIGYVMPSSVSKIDPPPVADCSAVEAKLADANARIAADKADAKRITDR